MSNESAFDLSKAMTLWRQEMIAAGVEDAEDLEELAGHLLEAIEEKVKNGLSEEQAFQGALAILGKPAELRREFELERNFMKPKLLAENGPLEPWVQKYRSALFIIGCAIYMSIAAVNLFKVPMDSTMRGLGILAIAAVPLVGWGCISAAKTFLVFRNPRLKTVCSIAFLVAGVAAFYFGIPYLLPLVSLTEPQFVIAVLFANVSLMLMAGIGIGMALGNPAPRPLSTE